MAAGLVKAAGDVADYGDNIDKMSQKMGLSIEAYQEWDAIMQHSGTSIESLQSGMKTLANAVESGNDAFERLGITQEQIASMNNEELFSATITALQNVDNETERTYLAGQLLGRGATELGALLNTSAEDTEAMRKRVHDLGGVMSTEAVKAAAKYKDSLQDMKTAFSGLSRNMTSDFLPSITTVMDGLTEIFSGNSDSGLVLISEGLSDFVDNLSDTVPRVLELGSRIVLDLSGAIINNLPKLLESGAQTVITLVNGIVNALPKLVAEAPKIVKTIADGISQNLPVLIPAAVSAVLQIVDTLIDNIDLLVDPAIEIIMALADGMINSIPLLIEKVPEIIEKLVTAIIENAPKLLNSAIELITKLAEGLLKPDTIRRLIEKAPEIVGKLISAIIENAPRLLTTALDLILKLVEGLADPDNLQNIFDAGVDFVWKLIEGVGSLLSNLWEVGKSLAVALHDGFIQQLKDSPLTDIIDGLTGGQLSFALNVEDMAKQFAGLIAPEYADQIAAMDTMAALRNPETATVDFASSSFGAASAAEVDATIRSALVGDSKYKQNIYLMTPEGDVLAEYIADPLAGLMSSRGTPITAN